MRINNLRIFDDNRLRVKNIPPIPSTNLKKEQNQQSQSQSKPRQDQSDFKSILEKKQR